MKRKLYYTRVFVDEGWYETFIAAKNKTNAIAIAEEYFESSVMDVKLCTLSDISKAKDKRVMHMSHIMTPLDKEAIEYYGIKQEVE